MRRLATALVTDGVEVAFDRDKRRRKIVLTQYIEAPEP